MFAEVGGEFTFGVAGGASAGKEFKVGCGELGAGESDAVVVACGEVAQADKVRVKSVIERRNFPIVVGQGCWRTSYKWINDA